MELFEQLPEIYPHPFYIKNDTGKFILANDAFAQLYNTKAKSLLATGYLGLDFSHDRDLEILKDGQSCTIEECYKRDDGRKIWFSTLKKPFEQPDGKLYLISVSADISPYKDPIQNREYLSPTLATSEKQVIINTAKAILEAARELPEENSGREYKAKTEIIINLARSLIIKSGNTMAGEPPLPTAHPNSFLSGFASAAARTATTSAEKSDNIKILLAEDNAASSEIIAAQLSAQGIKVDLAFDGKDALHKATEKVYDLIFMDIQMPRMDGLDATKYIRQASNPNSQTPIIAFSANMSGLSAAEYQSEGFTDFLPKPYAEADLLAVLSRYLRLPENLFQPENKLYDFSGLGDLSRDAVFIRKMKSLFIQTVPRQLNELNAAVAQKDWPKVIDIAHKLKSTYANIKIKEPAAAMKEIELIGLKKGDYSQIPNLLNQAEEITAKVLKVFSTYI